LGNMAFGIWIAFGRFLE